MHYVITGFDWDDANAKKCTKHGVPLAEIEMLFMHPLSVYPDLKHSSVETRFLAIGCTEGGRHIFLAFTLREKNSCMYVRPISARYMHAKEVTHYKRYEKKYEKDA